MSKRNPITLTAIRDELKKCQFNPNEPGAMAIIADCTDPKYWELRALEQIREVHALKLEGREAEERLQLVIKLMALSLAERHRASNSIH
jgi:hypothetical protein